MEAMKLQNLGCSYGWFYHLDSFNGVSQQRLGKEPLSTLMLENTQ